MASESTIKSVNITVISLMIFGIIVTFLGILSRSPFALVGIAVVFLSNVITIFALYNESINGWIAYVVLMIGGFILSYGMYFDGDAYIFFASFLTFFRLSTFGPKVMLTTLVALTTINITHFNGYKIYGTSKRYDNRPVINNPIDVKEIRLPNEIISKSGERYIIKDIVLNKAGLHNLEIILTMAKSYSIEADAASPSGLVIDDIGSRIYCGFQDRYFFPKRTPIYIRRDLKEYIIRQGYAENFDKRAKINE